MNIPEKKFEDHEDHTFPLSIYRLGIAEELPPHYHDNFEILFVKAGEMNITIGSETYHARKGSIFFVNMYQVHSAVSKEKKRCVFYAIVFDKSILDMINTNNYYIEYIKPFIDGQERFPGNISFDSDLYFEIRSSLDLMLEEYKSKELAYEIFIKTAIERLFASLVRHSKVLTENTSNKLSITEKYLLDMLYIYIQKNYMKPITLDDISSYLKINKYYFCRLIKKLTGRSYTQFLNMYRIRQSEILLRTSTLTIGDISERSGFQNLSYFNRIFLKYTGSTPSKLKKSMKT